MSNNWPLRFLAWGILGTIADVVAAIIVTSWFSFINAGALPADRIISASNAEIQLDSFLVAGFIVGFFYLWERLEGGLEQLSLKPLVTLSFSGIISFALSGLLAVAAILTVDWRYLSGATVLLVNGVWLVIWSWYTLQSMLRDLGKIRVKD